MSPLPAAALVALVAGCASPGSVEVRGDRRQDDRHEVVALTIDLDRDGPGTPAGREWDHPLTPRRADAVAVAHDIDPDLVAAQGGSGRQVADLLDGLGPSFRGLSLPAGGPTGDPDAAPLGAALGVDHVAILWRHDRFERFADGSFAIGSADGGTPPRQAAWVELEERASGRLLVALVADWDPADPDARALAAGLTVQHLDLVAPAPRGRVVLGALHTGPHSAEFGSLRDGGRLVDAVAEANPGEDPGGTSHGYGGVPGGPRVDHILLSAGRFAVEAAGPVVAEGPYGWPGPRFPVAARMVW